MGAPALPVSGLPAIDEAGRSRAHRAARLEGWHEASMAAMRAVSSHLGSSEELPAFFGRLSKAIAELTGAKRAAFWRLGPRGTLALESAPYGFPGDSPAYDARLQLGGDGNGVVEALVFTDDLDLDKGTCAGLDETWHKLGLIDVRNSIAAAWTAGERRVGAVAVYDAPRGFTPQDVWMLRLFGMVAGLVWQYKESEDELGRIAGRLEEATAARRHLLNNIAAGGDEARRRFASSLHDDSLQLLTAAELQLERIRGEAGLGRQAAQLDQLSNTLHDVEESLRKLLTNVSPEPLQMATDLSTGISERLESLRIRAGIEALVDARIPPDLPQAIQGLVLKNIAEALNNVEKHAHATRVTVVAETFEGGLRMQVSDDGTGFVASESTRVPGHIGLVAMRERAQLAGGWCRIHSDPGAGTKVEFWVPVSL